MTWFDGGVKLHDLHTKSVGPLSESYRTSTDRDRLAVQFTKHIINAQTEWTQLTHDVCQCGYTDKLQLVLYRRDTVCDARTSTHVSWLHRSFDQRHLNAIIIHISNSHTTQLNLFTIYIHVVSHILLNHNHRWTLSSMPKVVSSRCSKIAWSTVSKAADKSRRISAAVSPRSTACSMSDSTRRTAVSVECHWRNPDCNDSRR